MRSAFAAVLFAALSSSVMAHPGHGTGDTNGLWHYVTSPLHAAPVVTVVVGLAAVSLAVRMVRARIHRRRSVKARRTDHK